MRAFWIHNTPIGFKKILLFSFLIVAWSIVNFLYSFSTLTQVIVTTSFLVILLALIFLALKRGVIIIRKTFINKVKHFQVRDKLLLLNPKGSLRQVYLPKENAIYSSLYLNNPSEWSYLDCIRNLVKKNKPTRKTALVLGGGAAVIPLGLLESFHFHSDVVEISTTLIQIAKRYFFPLKKEVLGINLSKIHFIQEDAFRFILKNKKQFGLIIVDLFNGAEILPAVRDQTFINKVRKVGEYIIVNFGIRGQTKNLHLAILSYIKGFHHFQIYVCKNNYVGIFSEKRKINNTNHEQRII